MKIKIIILLLLFSSVCSATNYYIKNGGNDGAAGTSDGTAWATISKINVETFSAGDSILFNRGDRFVGTITPSNSGSSGDHIIFGAYGTGNLPVITPNDTIDGIEWTHRGSGIYKTTDIGYNPENLLINDTAKINKVNDYWMTHTPTNNYYANDDGWDILANASDKTYNLHYLGTTINFWDGLEALYAYYSDTVFISFRNDDDPADYDLYFAESNSSAVSIVDERYITIQNLHLLGGERGVYLDDINHVDDTSNIIIENCYIESSNRKIYMNDNVNGIIIRNNTITNEYMGGFSPCAWENGSTYIHAIGEHYYDFGKYYIGTSASTDADQAISTRIPSMENISIYGDSIIGCINGIGLNGANMHVRNCYINGTSSVGILFSVDSDSCSAYDNYTVNSNIAYRFQQVDNNSTTRYNYVYRNRVYNPNAGEWIYIHYAGSNPSNTIVWIYHNSIICNEGISCSSYADDTGDSTGFMFVNNIISASEYNSTGSSALSVEDNLYTFYYNWVGGDFYGCAYQACSGDTALWATNRNNIIYFDDTFWDHSDDPPDFDIEGSEALDAGVDITSSFTLGDNTYDALPGAFTYDEDPDIGYYEYSFDEPPAEPSIATNPVTLIRSIRAFTGGSVINDGGGTVSAKGICYGISANPTTSNNTINCGSGTADFTTYITGLTSNTTYHVRAYATNETGTSYGADRSFTTSEFSYGRSSNGKILRSNGKTIIIR